MSLLNDLFAKPLDPGYEEAAERARAAGDDAEEKDRFNVSPALIIGMAALGLLLTMAAIQVRDTAGAVSSEREDLIERINAEDEHVNELENSVNSLESEVSALESDLLEDSTAGSELREEVESLQAHAGSINVAGPGVVVTVDDAEDPDSFADPALAAVQDVDLQQVVNGLWAAGAEAVSINGQRITPLTAIRRVDNVMKINYRPTQPPFEISAAGDSASLPSVFGDGSGGQWLRYSASKYGLQFEVSAEESLSIPASNTSLTYANPGEAT